MASRKERIDLFNILLSVVVEILVGAIISTAFMVNFWGLLAVAAAVAVAVVGRDRRLVPGRL